MAAFGGKGAPPFGGGGADSGLPFGKDKMAGKVPPAAKKAPPKKAAAKKMPPNHGKPTKGKFRGGDTPRDRSDKGNY